MLIKPSKLRKGDLVGVIAPASPPNQKQLQKGIEYLQNLGLRVEVGKHVYDEYGYLAGKDQDRAEDIHEMFANPEVKALISACGGFGTGRMASLLDYKLIKQNPKIFWGYSDLSFLHIAIRQCANLVTFHGPMLASDMGKVSFQETTSQFFQQLFHTHNLVYDESISPIHIPVKGEAVGELVGGNLNLLVTTLGTQYEIDTQGKILLIEDVNEEPYQIDRMLNQLWMAGKLQNLAGLIVGDFNNCVASSVEKSFTLEEVLHHYIQRMNIPTLQGLQIGHCSPNIGVPLGSLAAIDTRNKRLVIESGVC